MSDYINPDTMLQLANARIQEFMREREAISLANQAMGENRLSVTRILKQLGETLSHLKPEQPLQSVILDDEPVTQANL